MHENNIMVHDTGKSTLIDCGLTAYNFAKQKLKKGKDPFSFKEGVLRFYSLIYVNIRYY